MSIDYIVHKKRVRQSLDYFEIPTQRHEDNQTLESSFDAVLQYVQEQREYWQSQIGQPISNYEYYRTTDRKAQCSHSEQHVFDTIYIGEGVKDLDRDGDPVWVPMIFGERDMTPGEIAYHEERAAKFEADDRRRFEELKKRFEPDENPKS